MCVGPHIGAKSISLIAFWFSLIGAMPWWDPFEPPPGTEFYSTEPQYSKFLQKARTFQTFVLFLFFDNIFLFCRNRWNVASKCSYEARAPPHSRNLIWSLYIKFLEVLQWRKLSPTYFLTKNFVTRSMPARVTVYRCFQRAMERGWTHDTKRTPPEIAGSSLRKTAWNLR